MPVLDRHDEIGVGLDLGGQLVLHDLHQIVALQQAVGVAVGQTLLGQEHQRHHDQGHVVMPSLPATSLVVGHPTTALRLLNGTLDEMPRPLHQRELPQRCIGLCIRQAALQFRPVEFSAHQKMPGTRLGRDSLNPSMLMLVPISFIRCHISNRLLIDGLCRPAGRNLLPIPVR